MSDDDTIVAFPPRRARLPNRRPELVETVIVDGGAYDMAVGFDPSTGRPREIFLAGAKDGSGMAAILADTSVVISVALQHGIPAEALARSILRQPRECGGAAASVIGAALDLLAQYERGEIA